MVLAEGTGHKGRGSPHPLRKPHKSPRPARHYLPWKRSLERQKACRSCLESNRGYRILIKTKEARSLALLCGLSVFTLLLFFLRKSILRQFFLRSFFNELVSAHPFYFLFSTFRKKKEGGRFERELGVSNLIPG